MRLALRKTMCSGWLMLKAKAALFSQLMSAKTPAISQ